MFINLMPTKPHQWLREHLIKKNEILKEYSIIQSWQENGWLPQGCLSTPLLLFRTHFFVFHQLYHFKKELLKNAEGDLEIHTLHIEFKSCQLSQRLKSQSQGSELSELDGLLHYYLDWRPFFETSEEQVNQLLTFAHLGIKQPYRLQAAFNRFEIKPPTSASAIKSAYRKLARKHHPDKGGDIRNIQMINEDRQLLFAWLEHQ